MHIQSQSVLCASPAPASPASPATPATIAAPAAPSSAAPTAPTNPYRPYQTAPAPASPTIGIAAALTTAQASQAHDSALVSARPDPLEWEHFDWSHPQHKKFQSVCMHMA
jgi:hypothetical protein